MGKKYLIDTNVISHLFSERLPQNGKDFLKKVIDENFIISVIVEIEILTYHELPDKMPLIEEFLQFANVLALDTITTQKTIELRRNNRKLKIADAIIAATAMVNDFILITNNTKDFKDIEGLELIDPHLI